MLRNTQRFVRRGYHTAVYADEYPFSLLVPLRAGTIFVVVVGARVAMAQSSGDKSSAERSGPTDRRPKIGGDRLGANNVGRVTRGV